MNTMTEYLLLKMLNLELVISNYEIFLQIIKIVCVLKFKLKIETNYEMRRSEREETRIKKMLCNVITKKSSNLF